MLGAGAESTVLPSHNNDTDSLGSGTEKFTASGLQYFVPKYVHLFRYLPVRFIKTISVKNKQKDANTHSLNTPESGSELTNQRAESEGKQHNMK
jgi:hypothetical protein